MDKKVVTRFAPSPTGFMHIGSARTALFAYLFAKKHNGVFILRIEDTDKVREVGGSVEHIIESLHWLGIQWDYGPDKQGPFGSTTQSHRLESYKKYAQKLIDVGLAYPDPYTQEEVTAFRDRAKSEKKPFLFRNHRPKIFQKWDGTKPLRFKVPEIKRYTWTDTVRGDLDAGEEMLDDIIIIKADGYPTYNFAHIIDDYEMGVTHVMRGDEFISSTPKFLSLYDALEIPYPVFATLPPILAPDGKKKLGKRDGAKDLLEYRNEGYLTYAMVNFLALIGWNPGTEQELFTIEELTDSFTLDKIQKSGGAFNEEKLLWMNKEYLQKMSYEDFLGYIIKALPKKTQELPQYTEDRLLKLIPIIKERVHIKAEITEAAEAGEYNFAFSTPDVDIEMISWKKDNSYADAIPRLKKVYTLLQNADFSSQESIKKAVWGYAEKVGIGELLWPLRISLTGRKHSPDPFVCAHIIGKEETLIRIQNVYDKMKQ